MAARNARHSACWCSMRRTRLGGHTSTSTPRGYHGSWRLTRLTPTLQSVALGTRLVRDRDTFQALCAFQTAETDAAPIGHVRELVDDWAEALDEVRRSGDREAHQGVVTILDYLQAEERRLGTRRRRRGAGQVALQVETTHRAGAIARWQTLHCPGRIVFEPQAFGTPKAGKKSKRKAKKPKIGF